MSRQGHRGIADAVAQFQNRPKPRQPASNPPSALHRNSPAPQAKRNQHCVADPEPQPQVSTDRSSHKTRRAEDFVQLRETLFDRMPRLSENQEQEDDLSAPLEGQGVSGDNEIVA